LSAKRLNKKPKRMNNDVLKRLRSNASLHRLKKLLKKRHSELRLKKPPKRPGRLLYLQRKRKMKKRIRA